MRTCAQFRRVYAAGRVFRDRGVDVRVALPPEGHVPPTARLGIAIRRSVVRTSVRRNRWKRWIREAFRRHPEAVVPGADIVVSVSEAPSDWRYPEVEKALVTLLTRARDQMRPR